MNLETTYMGLKLKSPLILSSSGITNNIENIVQAAENGIGAVVLKSLFEEQIIADRKNLFSKDSMFFWYPQAIDYIDNLTKEHGVEQYIGLLNEAKERTDIPVIASINCVSANIWPEFAQKLEAAGADAIELNISIMPTNTKLTTEEIHKSYIDIIKEVKKYTKIPVAVKLGFYFTNLLYELIKFCEAGIEGMVLFNRYYRPDIDIDQLRIVSDNYLSAPEELNLSLRWIALLYNKIECDLSASTGIHDYKGAVKQILAGASSVQICTTVYKNGIDHIRTINSDILKWMESKDFKKIDHFKGLIARRHQDGSAFERVQYIKRTVDTQYKPVSLM
jgi:dihydroorotate dehydrogenase (fumarate)